MKIYLIVETNKVISGFSYDRIADSIEFETDNPFAIKYGIDTFEDGEVVSKEVSSEILNRKRILDLKKMLADSDYLCLKHADGELTDEEYASVKAQRHAWRVEINELEK